jgi:Tol biopolymer transport system component
VARRRQVPEVAVLCAWIVWVVAACGNVSARLDAASDSPALSDAAPRRCDPAKPFGAAMPITELNTPAHDDAAWLTSDERTIYFSSTRAGGPGGFDIYLATRASPEAQWSTPALVAGVNTAGMDRHPVLSPDGLAMYAERQTGTDYNLLVATRQSPSAPFGALSDEPTLNGTSSDDSPFVLSDRTMLFHSARSGFSELYQATWDGMKYTEITMLGGIEDRTANNGDPILTGDRQTLYWSSDRAGGAGGFDIWVATRAAPSGRFGGATNLTGLNTANIDAPSWVSADGCVLQFTRLVSPVGGTANYDLYQAVKPL